MNIVSEGTYNFARLGMVARDTYAHLGGGHLRGLPNAHLTHR